jgi:hypothetical protein
MSEDLFVAATIIAIVGLGAVVFYLYLERAEQRRDIDWLYKELSQKTSDVMYEFERDHRRELQNELQAIKDYLHIESVKIKASVCMMKKEKNT